MVIMCFKLFLIILILIPQSVNCTTGFDCDNPPTPLGGFTNSVSKNNSEKRPTFEFHFGCHEGFILLGSEVISCISGELDGDVPLCVVDVAKFKIASQSSLGSVAGKAIEPRNEFVSKHEGKFCSQTSPDDKSPWWKIDLLIPITILSINITLANDLQLPKSIEVRVGNNSDHRSNPLCQWLSSKSQNSFLVKCVEDLVGRFISLAAFSPSGTPLTMCHLKVLTNQIQSAISCNPVGLSSGSFILMDKCIIKNNNERLNFNDSVSFCAGSGLGLLTNRNPVLYNLMLGVENDERAGRKVIWLGAKLNPKNAKWQWIPENIESDQFDNESRLVEEFSWGLHEPSGEDCVVVDSALKWRWNSVRCVISANVICEGSLKSCPMPDSNFHSNINTFQRNSNFPVGSKVEYSCPEGFKVEGPLVRTCLENGRWSGMAPKCHFYDCGLYPASDGLSIVYLGKDNSTSFGSEVHLSCQDGFINENQKLLVYKGSSNFIHHVSSGKCTDQGWSISKMSCYKVTCQFHQMETNLSFVISMHKMEIEASNFTCPSGYTTKYDSLAKFPVCMESVWHPDLPECLMKPEDENMDQDKYFFPEKDLTNESANSGMTTTKRPEFKELPPESGGTQHCQTFITFMLPLFMLHRFFKNV